MNFFSLNNLYKISRFFFKNEYKKLSTIIDFMNRRINKCVVYGETDIGEGTEFAYGGLSLVIHKNAVIGKNCMIGQCITIGRVPGTGKEIPVIEDNVYIGAGARILGGINIGNNSIIAPNAVVTRDVNPCSVVGGIPAKLITEINKENYLSKFKFYGIKKYVS